jgi:flagellar operon protein
VEKVSIVDGAPSLTVGGKSGIDPVKVTEGPMTGLAHNPAVAPPGAAQEAPKVAPAPPAGAPHGTAALRLPGPTFGDVLHKHVGELRFSSHALQRLERRGIDVGGETMERLQSGVARAAGKGSRESVVLVDETAFVVSVRNRTVITAVGSQHMKDHVFTNIDSAVIA